MADYKTSYCLHCLTPVNPGSGEFCHECGRKHSVHYAQSYELPAGTYLKGDRYIVGESIGSGGFGISYIGFDFSLQRRVLVKETFYSGLFKRNCYDKTNFTPLNVSYGSEFSLAKIMRKTEKECLAMSEGKGLNNVVKVYDWFAENNTAYIITEFIDGVTLDEKLRAKGRYSWAELYRKLVPLMYNLSVLHGKGIIHRDIKPQNIMIRNGTEEFILIDFGLARSIETKTLASVGVSFSPGYSPFEQRSYTKQDNTYTDIYALAATIYFALTGEPPSLDMHETIDGNFPKMDLLRTEYNVPENVVKALRYALNPNFNLRCSSVTELMHMLSDSEQKQPHYLRGNPQQYVNNQGNGSSDYSRRSEDEIQQIRSQYQKKRQEQEMQSLQQQNEIGETLNKLVGYYRKRGTKDGVGPIDFRKYIVPGVVVLIMVIVLMITK